MTKQKDKCEICKEGKKRTLFLVKFQIEGYYLYCNQCLATVIQEKPKTVIKTWQLDNKNYEIIFTENKEVE